MRLLRALALASVVTLVTAADLPAQGTFAQLGQLLHPNDRVRLTVAGARFDGTLIQVTADELVLATNGNRSTFQCPQIRRVEKRGDPIWTGAVIGAAVAALPAWNGCQNKGRNLPCVALGVSAYAAVGGLIDKARVGARTVYVASPRSCGN